MVMSTKKGKAKPNMSHNPPERHIIDRTYRVSVPCGKIYEVNVFDYNLHSICAQSDPSFNEQFIQLEDTSWARFRNLKLVKEADRDG